MQMSESKPDAPHASELTPDELRRYARHMPLSGVGPEGQAALRRARVLVVGAGGLGSPAALYLAAAGVGRITLLDGDRVELSNLQRQILHGTSDVGRLKVESGAERLGDLNPEIEVRVRAEPITSANARALVADHDITVDGSDNFPTRYLVNDASILEGRPWVYGAILRWEGQLSVFGTPGGPCYRCIFRDPPPPGVVPGCAEAGVLGVLPGVMGSLQALEALRWILRNEDASPAGEAEGGAIGRLLVFDSRRLAFRWLHPARDPGCPVCGDEREINELIDYDWFCATGDVRAAPTPSEGSADLEKTSDPAAPATAPGSGHAGGRVPATGIRDIEPAELLMTMAAEEGAAENAQEPPLLLDVREGWEWAGGNLGELGAEHLPLAELDRQAADPQWLELARQRGVVTLCETGRRSLEGAQVLLDAGVDRVAHLAGGMKAWRHFRAHRSEVAGGASGEGA